jgi:hypothetical protein
MFGAADGYRTSMRRIPQESDEIRSEMGQTLALIGSVVMVIIGALLIGFAV